MLAAEDDLNGRRIKRGVVLTVIVAAGASQARDFMCKNDSSAVADANNEVAESDETNNSRLAPGTHCIT
jgi:hypothetical protein